MNKTMIKNMVVLCISMMFLATLGYAAPMDISTIDKSDCQADFCISKDDCITKYIKIREGNYSFEVDGFWGSKRYAKWYVNDTWMETDTVQARRYLDPHLN